MPWSGSEFMTKRKEAGCRVHSVRGGENGRKEVDGIVRVTWLTICSVARGRESSSGTECGGIARVHLPESYFPPVHYWTVRAAWYIRATARTEHPQLQPSTRAFYINERYFKRSYAAYLPSLSRMNRLKWKRNWLCKQYMRMITVRMSSEVPVLLNSQCQLTFCGSNGNLYTLNSKQYRCGFIIIILIVLVLMFTSTWSRFITSWVLNSRCW